MKKRKELNALIGLGPGDGRGRSRRSRRAWRGAAGHRLLRTEPPASGSASSSEDEDDDDDEDDEEEDERGGGGGGGARARFARGDYFRCCKVCYPLCAFVILAACVVACVGLVWMQVALKEDLDGLKDQFRILESNQKSSFQEIPKLNEDLLRKQKQLEKIESGDLGLSKVWINITEMTKQIALLTSTVNRLKANIKSASDLISLPATVEGLQKSVASIGSTLNSVRLAVEAVQKTVDEHKRTIEALQRDTDPIWRGVLGASATTSTPGPQIQHPEKQSSKAAPSPSMVPGLGRKSPRENFQQVAAGAASLNRDSHRTVGEQAPILKKEDNEDTQASKLKEKLQLINALTGKPEPKQPREEASEDEKKQSSASKPSTFPKYSPRSLGNQMETAAHLRPVSIPEISSLTADLQDLFQKTDQGPEGKLSYQDLQDLLGSGVPSAQSMAEFDMDGDGRYSFLELTLALGIEHMGQN
ncbi:EF-hand calcium-binding domain-containing protein 14 isoform X7 [Phascolarctos cinereus]|uniref:EF-hand calcium-binding domain-containing protein 14 isoform X6 n=1 Tax=Phascolarctos cinereus TaxID=38626 RepID=A0A6P5KCU9_PHACI|nr:EF-hand calcium-binding domain-containing protein 14 isoform X6 [Phascolarctos cinereus]